MKSLSIALIAACCAIPALAAEPSHACAAKRASIESQIAEAQAQGRSQQLAGLNKALNANKARCTDASLEADRQRDIQNATRKVSEREADLAKAQAKGDARKIAKEQAQLDEARAALAQAHKPLLP